MVNLSYDSLFSAENSTLIYIIILAILVMVVIALVVYALNSMKSADDGGEQMVQEKPAKKRKSKKASEAQPEAPAYVSDDSEDVKQLKARFAEALQAKNREIEEKDREIEQLRMRLEAAEKLAADTQARLRRSATAQAKPTAPRREPTTVYLARANAAGDFVRADSRMNLGNSVFTLVTTDGVTGTFSVIDNPTVHEVALTMPSEYLANACTSSDLQLTSGMRHIVTDAPGTAVFDHGRWHITRKARISYTK